MRRTRLAAAAMSGLGIAAAAAVPAHAAAPAAAKVHYLGACHASGSYPNCSIFGRSVNDTASIHVHVWGSVTVPGQGRGRIEADWDDLCDKGDSSSDESGMLKDWPAYTRSIPQAWSKADSCWPSANISPVSFEGHGTIHAYITYTRRDGR
jgi:hypothetical protein